MVGDVVQITLGITGFIVDGRGYDPVPDGKDGKDGLNGTRGPDHMTDHGFVGGDRRFSAVFLEYRLDRLGLGDIVQRR